MRLDRARATHQMDTSQTLTIFSQVKFYSTMCIYIECQAQNFFVFARFACLMMNSQCCCGTNTFICICIRCHCLYICEFVFRSKTFTLYIPIKILYQCQHNGIKKSTLSDKSETKEWTAFIVDHFMNYWNIRRSVYRFALLALFFFFYL